MSSSRIWTIVAVMICIGLIVALVSCTQDQEQRTPTTSAQEREQTAPYAPEVSRQEESAPAVGTPEESAAQERTAPEVSRQEESAPAVGTPEESAPAEGIEVRVVERPPAEMLSLREIRLRRAQEQGATDVGGGAQGTQAEARPVQRLEFAPRVLRAEDPRRQLSETEALPPTALDLALQAAEEGELRPQLEETPS